jgi:starch-binding outer membrane protein, SusD/RagB family
MKNSIKLIPASCYLVLITLFAAACNDILDEKPYTTFTKDYFKTEGGFRSAVVTGYAGMRFNYGPIGALDLNVFGTDEWTNGDQAIGSPLNVYNVSTSEGDLLTPWNNNFWHINTLNLVINMTEEESPEIDSVKRKLWVAEARYLRAHYYYLLVTQFGAVPLNLGSGELMFNELPVSDFHRLPVDDLLVRNYQLMIDDLTAAAKDLPDQRPANAFNLSKAAALHMLAKIYLYRGYSAARQATDFQNAYNTAMQVINGKATYGVDLLQNFAEVFREGNDYNKEIIYAVERLPRNNTANEMLDPTNDFANKANMSNNEFNSNYQGPVFAYDPADPDKKQAYIDGRPLEYGRPLRRFAPTKWLFETAFADKENDSRFDNSFRMMWYARSVSATPPAAYVERLKIIGLDVGDTAIFLTKTDREADSLRGLTGAQKKYYRVFGPSEFYTNAKRDNLVYPSLTKFQSLQRANFNDASGRPLPVSRFAETYLLAAEAAMLLGQQAEAADLINVLKRRAVYRPGLTTAELDARYARIEVDASDIDIDFILDERTRELAGEHSRWPDLAARGKLLDRVPSRNVDAVNLKAHHVVRPIPQSQLDRIADPDKAKYQNPVY